MVQMVQMECVLLCSSEFFFFFEAKRVLKSAETHLLSNQDLFLYGSCTSMSRGSIRVKLNVRCPPIWHSSAVACEPRPGLASVYA